MKYVVQEHEEKTKEFIVYQLASNGEICRKIASCRERKDADNIIYMLNEKS